MHVRLISAMDIKFMVLLKIQMNILYGDLRSNQEARVEISRKVISIAGFALSLTRLYLNIIHRVKCLQWISCWCNMV